jgi:hypothetical protein
MARQPAPGEAAPHRPQRRHRRLKNFIVLGAKALPLQSPIQVKKIRLIYIDRQAHPLDGNPPGALFEFALHIIHLGIFST